MGVGRVTPTHRKPATMVHEAEEKFATIFTTNRSLSQQLHDVFSWGYTETQLDLNNDLAACQSVPAGFRARCRGIIYHFVSVHHPLRQRAMMLSLSSTNTVSASVTLQHFITNVLDMYSEFGSACAWEFSLFPAGPGFVHWSSHLQYNV